MPQRPPEPSIEAWMNDVGRRLRDVERQRLRLPPGADPLQTFEDGSPLGDTRFLNFGAGINASLVGDEYVLVEGSGGGGCGGATVTVAAFDSHQAALDCADFVCTGVNDEVTLNAARAECVLRSTIAGGAILTGKVLLFQGTYLLKNTWTNNTQPVRFEGFGHGTYIKADTGFAGTSVISMATGTGAGQTGATFIDHMRIDGNSLASYGVDLGGPFSPNPLTHRQLASNLFITGTTQAGIRAQAGIGPAAFIDNVDVETTGLYGLYVDGSNPGRISNCRISGASSIGILTRGRVEGCVITDCDTGIYLNNDGLSGDTDSTCVGNFISGGDVGIEMACFEGVVSSNSIATCGEYGILITGGKNVVSSNNVNEAGTDGTFAGIRAQGDGDENLIIGNKVRNATGFGLQFSSTANNNIDAFNDLRNNTGGTYTDAGAGNLHYPTTPGTGLAPSNADYLVGTANADLSAEIVAGPTPGGELGGTWASPTVDTTHSGSAHADFIAKAFLDAKGDLISASANDTPVILTVGTNNFVLVADSTTASGLAWKNVTTLLNPTAGWGGITNESVDRAYDADATTLDEIADTLATLVNDLIAQGILAT